MKVHQEKNEIESSGDLAQANFGLEFNPKIARMLSEQVYSDPILAVVREYICNAWDAHTMVGNTNPIQVRIPSALDPQWAVRDYGPGLSQAQIMGTADNNWRGLFNTYGKSGKDHSDQFIGGFGIGSKAGFAYTRQDLAFTITAWHEGIKNTFTASMNADGIPQLMLMACEPSNEPSGVEIAMPVKTKDINTFISHTHAVCEHAPVKPDILGGTMTWEPRTYVQSGKDWRRVGVVHDYTGIPKVLIGNIGYPIDPDQFTGDSVRLLNSAIEIDIPIGSVELSLDRESLSYDARTVAYLQARLDTIYKEVQDLYEEKFNTLLTYWDKCLAYGQYTKDCINTSGYGITSRVFKHKGKVLKRNFQITQNALMGVEYCYLDSSRLNKLDNIRYTQSISISAKPNVYIVWNDCTSARIRPKFYRLAAMLKDVKNAYVYVVKTSSKLKFAKARAMLGWPTNYIHVNTLEDLYPDTEEYTKTVRDKYDLRRNVLVLSNGYRATRADYFRQETLDFATPDTIYYIWVNAYYLYPSTDFEDQERITPQTFYNKVVGALKELGHKPKIYCISRMYECHVAGKANFINVADFAKSILPDAQTLQDAAEHLAAEDKFIEKYRDITHQYLRGTTTYKQTLLYAAMEAHKKNDTHRNAYSKVQNIQGLHAALRTGIPIEIPKVAPKTVIDFGNYPMLKVLDSFYSYEKHKFEIIANYIKECEKNVSLQSA